MSETPVERAVLLDLLVFHDDKVENIANRTGYHRNSVSRRIPEMLDKGLVKNKGGGTYRLTESGRELAQGIARSELDIYES